jgi:hypothetical protein
MRYWFFTFFLLTLVVQQFMTSALPVGNEEDKEAFEDVKALESLRNDNSKSNNTDRNHQIDSSSGKATPQPPKNEEAQPQSTRGSAIFRHRGITQAKKSKYWNEKIEQPNQGYTKYAGIQYSPTDLAEYVFSTGDEEGVAVAVEELVREGMMGRTDAINYLQDVKQMLAYMRDQYEKQEKLQELKNRAYPKPQVSQRLPSPPREQFISQMIAEKREPDESELVPAAVATTEHPHQEVIASTSEPKVMTHSASTTARPKTDSSVAVDEKDDDYKRTMKNRNTETYKFALQVIYNLAKDMFTESILKDDPVAEDTLSRLVAFMENEVENKRISPEMKQNVLAIISSALVDSLREYQRVMPENQPQNFEEGNFYRHLSNQNPPPSSKMDKPDAYRKLTVGG